LTKLKEIKKKQKPTFRAQNSWRFKRVDPRWRRPRGIDSKMREKLKGHPKLVNIGYRSSKLLRNKYYSDKRGLLEEFIVSNMSDLDLVLPHKHIVRINGNLGQRKKEKLFQEAVSWGLYVINPMKSKEEFDETDLTEDLSLDRDLGLDLDLEDVEDLDLDEKSEEEKK
jgi:large subunit ribosomal protein L32e